LLRSGHFQSQEDMARALNTSSSQVSRLLKLARLPSIVIDAFSSPVEICAAWGLDIIAALDDPTRRQATMQRAREISGCAPRPPGRDVHRQLLAAAVKGRRLRAKSHDEVVKDARGRPVFRIRRMSNAVALLLPSERLSERTLTEVRLAMLRLLEAEESHISHRSTAAMNVADHDEHNTHVGLR